MFEVEVISLLSLDAELKMCWPAYISLNTVIECLHLLIRR